MKFVGRNHELKLLSKLYNRTNAQFLILYGRRRIGKTSLLQHWITSQTGTPNILYWMATQTSTVNQLRHFSQHLLRFLSPDTPVTKPNRDDVHASVPTCETFASLPGVNTTFPAV